LGELEGVGEGIWVRKRAGAGKKKAKVQIKAILSGIGIANRMYIRGDGSSCAVPIKFSNAGQFKLGSLTSARWGCVVSVLQAFGRLLGGESKIGSGGGGLTRHRCQTNNLFFLLTLAISHSPLNLKSESIW
jgi:hypothetical protein